jgi:O-antigen/teichoic acid export membrane protein
MYVYNFPSILVPIVYGLGGPTIIFDTAFKVFRGATVLFSATSDLIVPRQTRAFTAGDRPALVRATWIALALGFVPALAVNVILLAAGTQLYHFLLGRSAVMPPEFTPILVVMIFCNLVQTVSNFLLVHTGFFSQIARSALFMVVVMTGVAGIEVALRPTIIQFAMLYATAYLVSAALYAALALRFPLKVSAIKAPLQEPA